MYSIYLVIVSFNIQLQGINIFILATVVDKLTLMNIEADDQIDKRLQ